MPVSCGAEWYESYAADGAASLTDGWFGPWNYGYRWLGFLNKDFEATIDLGAVKAIREVKADFLQWHSALIGLPKSVEIAVSEDGEHFTVLGEELQRPSVRRPGSSSVRAFGWEWYAQARYVRCRAAFHGNAGGWIFIDEIVVN